MVQKQQTETILHRFPITPPRHPNSQERCTTYTYRRKDHDGSITAWTSTNKLMLLTTFSVRQQCIQFIESVIAMNRVMRSEDSTYIAPEIPAH